MTATTHGRSGRPWRRIRAAVLQRDPWCTIRGPRCTGVSTHVDHVIPLSTRPDLAHELGNLRGACAACNLAGGARITNAKRRNGALRNGAYARQAASLRPFRPSREW